MTNRTYITALMQYRLSRLRNQHPRTPQTANAILRMERAIQGQRACELRWVETIEFSLNF